MNQHLRTFTKNSTVTNWQKLLLTAIALVAMQWTLLAVPLQIQFSITHPACGGFNTGSVTANVTGGNAPYTYLWSNGATTQTISNVGAGSYDLTVTDASSTTATGTAVVTEPLPLTGTATSTCTVPATITATPNGGVGPYTYSWSSGQSGQTISVTTSGQYCVTITDVNLCGVVVCSNVGSGPSVSVSTTDLTCYNSGDGTAVANVSGGTPPYSFAWNSGQSGQSISNLTPGTYVVTVTDAAGCTGTASGVVGNPNPVFATITSTNPGCNGSPPGSATVSASGGIPPYTYLWSNGQTGPTIFNLTAGMYSVTVTDANGCQKVSSVTLTGGSGITVTASSTDETCYGFSDGTATASVSGGATPFSYQWSNGGNTQTITGLAPGNYTVSVVDASGCTGSASVFVNAAPIFGFSINSTDVSSCGADDGTAMVSPNGGTAPYTYLWSTGATTQTISGLSGGTYSVTVTDTHGCFTVGSVVINAPSNLSVGASGTPVVCQGNLNGSATANVSGGIAPFTYAWSNGGNTQTITGIGPGTYTVTVTDAAGCAGSASVTIQSAPAINLVLSSTDDTCGTTDEGSATALASGGTPPYTYFWNTGATTATIDDLAAGTYSVTVSDINGCIATGSVVIDVFDDLIVDVDKQDVLCNGTSDGSILVSGWGGTPPYTYLWASGAATPAISGLPAGSYTVTVTDAVGCVAVETVILTEPPALVVTTSQTDVNCSGANNGSATANASGGVSPYTYQWSTGATTSSIFNLAPGSYSVTVMDANLCAYITSVIITQVDDFIVDIEKENVSCHGGNDGSILSSGWGGTAPYTFVWNTGANTPGISNLTAGTYSVTSTDANGCVATETVVISEPPPIALSINATDVSCNGGNNGSATVNATGGIPPYSYLWNTGATTASLANIGIGTYSVTVTDDNGCIESASVTIGQSDVLTVDEVTQHVSCYGGNDGSILSSGWGGTPPYTYLWNTGATTPEITNLTAGDYTVTVTDDNGCVASATFTVTQPTQVSVSISSVDVSCNGANNGSATANASGGTPPYTYSWNTGSTDQTISGIGVGTYTVTVTDANNCSATASVDIGEADELTIDSAKHDVSCYGGNDGSVLAEGWGGTPPYSYQWSNGETTDEIINLTAGDYTVTVTDANGCVVVETITITEPPQLVPNITANNVSCNGVNNGSATASASGGTPPYTYTWNNGSTLQTISGLGPGTYSVTVMDANYCTESISVDITEADELTIDSANHDVSCHGGNDGSILAEGWGGTPPYTYQWSTGATTDEITGLTAGDYTVTVTDANNCIVIETITITEPSELIVNITAVNAYCTGGSNGSANAMVSGGTTPYTYSWNNGATSQSISGLSSGTYTLTVMDANFCTVTASVTIASTPEPTCTASVQTPISTAGSSDGEAIVNASSGTAPYTYLWSDGQTTQVATGLSAGTYSVTVTDANGCTTFCSVSLDEPCDNVTSGGMIGYDQYLCGPGIDAAPLVELAPPSGGSGALQYLWMYTTSYTPFDPSTWLVVPNGTGPTIDPGLIYETTYFIRCSRRVGCTAYHESNIITITVGTDAVADIQGPDTVCVGDLVTYTSGNTDAGNVYNWTFANGSPASATTASVNVSWNAPGLRRVDLSVTNNGCTSTDFIDVFVTDNPVHCARPLLIKATPMSQQEVMVEWVMETQSAGYHYVIERSADGENFVEIGDELHLPGFINYSFLDQAPKKGRSFYRVRLEDQNGIEMISNVEEIMLHAGISVAFIYPNPFDEEVFVELLEPDVENISIDIFTPTGVRLQRIEHTSGDFREAIDLSLQPAGVYLFAVNYHDTTIKVFKVFKR